MDEEELREAELPLDSVGTRLRRAREGMSLGRADIASRTKIAERHLVAIEEDRFGDLASGTYAVGFSRAYARAVGLDEMEIARTVRAVLAGSPAGGERGSAENFEPGDPARIPASRTAWIAALGALAVLGLIFLLWRSYLSPGGTLPDLTQEPAAASAAASAPAASGAPAAAPAGGPVVFTATQDGVWVKFYDASGAQLMQKQMALGERYEVPGDADGPQVWTARPDALAITVGGRPLAPLADRQVTVKDVPVSAASLLARGAVPMAAASSPAAGLPLPTAQPAVRPAPAALSSPSARVRAEAPARTAAPIVSPPADSPPPIPAPAGETSTVSE